MKSRTRAIILIIGILLVCIAIIIQVYNISSNRTKQISKVEEEMKTASTVGTETDLSEFSYIKDDSEKTVTLKKYISTTTESIYIYEKYSIGGVKYTTIVEQENRSSFFGEENNNIITQVFFRGNVKLKGNLDYFFAECTKLKSVDFGNIQNEGTRKYDGYVLQL